MHRVVKLRPALEDLVDLPIVDLERARADVQALPPAKLVIAGELAWQRAKSTNGDERARNLYICAFICQRLADERIWDVYSVND